MPFNHLSRLSALTIFLAGGATSALAQPVTEGAAAAVTGKASTDGPANTSVQGTARAVREAAAPVAASVAQGAAPAPAALPARVVQAGDLIETARASGQFATFIKAVEATNLTRVLKTTPNLTVFVPTDAAFAALPPGELDRLMADRPALQKLLAHHLINARVESAKIRGAKGPVNTVANDPVELDGSGPVLRAGAATIVQADVMTTNGVLHVIDRVLTPVPPAPVGAAADAAATISTPAGAATAVPTTPQ